MHGFPPRHGAGRILIKYPVVADQLQEMRAILETIPGERFRFLSAIRESGGPPEPIRSDIRLGKPTSAEGDR